MRSGMSATKSHLLVKSAPHNARDAEKVPLFAVNLIGED